MEEPLPHPHHSRTLQDYVRILVKRRWVALATFIGIVGAVALYNFTAIPIYTAAVQILIERQTTRVLDQQASPGIYDYSNEEFYQTQYKLLEGRALARKVADKLKLQNNPYFAGIFEDLPPNADEALRQRAEERLVGALQGGVEVSPIRSSRLVNLKYHHTDPKFAAQVANAMAQCFIEQSLDFQFAAAQETSNWLQQKLTEARKKLEESETKLNRYKREQNIVTLEDKESITAQKLEQLNRDLVAATTHRMETETRFKEVSQGRPIAQVLNNPLIQTLKTQEAKILAEQSELARKFGQEHPRMIQLANELSATRAKIGAEMSQVVQSIKNEYNMAKVQEENLKGALESQKSDTQDLSDRGIQYRVLLRDVETNRALYENMLKSLKATTATESLPATNIRIVYPAAIPEVPVSPKKFNNIVLAAIMGLILGMVAVLGLESLDTTLKTPEELESWLEVPNLALIPHLELAAGNPGEEISELVVHHGTQPLASEAYRAIRTSVLFSTPGHSPQVLLITSSLPVEGKSLTAANLATAMAKAEPGVLLVDADLRRPSLHHIFQLPSEPGLSNFLVGEIDELPLISTSIPNLSVITCGHIPPNPSELLGSARMRDFLNLAKDRFHRVIIDSPPLLSVTDGAILATQVEGVILVVKAETVPRKAAMDAKDKLVEVKAHLLGTVLNNVPIQRDSYYYNYYYRYYEYHTPQDGSSGHRQGRRSPPPAQAGALAWLKDRFSKLKEKI